MLRDARKEYDFRLQLVSVLYLFKVMPRLSLNSIWEDLVFLHLRCGIKYPKWCFNKHLYFKWLKNKRQLTTNNKRVRSNKKTPDFRIHYPDYIERFFAVSVACLFLRLSTGSVSASSNFCCFSASNKASEAFLRSTMRACASSSSSNEIKPS